MMRMRCDWEGVGWPPDGGGSKKTPWGREERGVGILVAWASDEAPLGKVSAEPQESRSAGDWWDREPRRERRLPDCAAVRGAEAPGGSGAALCSWP